MKTVSEHLTHLKGKPHHIRKRVAFATAAGVAACIALVWLIGNLSLGTFAIAGSSFADSTAQSPVVTTSGSDSGDSGLAGVAAALPSASAPAHIEIVDAPSSAPS